MELFHVIAPSIFFNHINSIFPYSPEPKMTWSYARRVIARMTNYLSLRDGPMVNLPGYPMRPHWSARMAIHHLPVPVISSLFSIKAPSPKPTRRSFPDVPPESFNNIGRAIFVFAGLTADCCFAYGRVAVKTFCKLISHRKISPFGVIPRTFIDVAGIFTGGLYHDMAIG